MSQPIPASAQDWNSLFNLAATIALIATAVVLGAMIYFALRYRERKGQSKYIPDLSLSKSRARDAVVFASISIIILIALTAASYRLTPNARFMPTSNYVSVDVTAFRWGFRFDYPGCNVSMVGELKVPANTTIKFNVTSTDVMHNFYLVQYKVSIDAIPGMYNILYVTTPSVTGNNTVNYQILCKELCGVGHTYMTATMIVMSSASFNQWLVSQETTSPTPGG